MKARNRWIVFLLIIGVIGSVGMHFFGIRQLEIRRTYLEDQLNPLAADFKYISSYENSYMGNASNLINLFYHLPLSSNSMNFELDSEDSSVEIYFDVSAREAGQVNLSTRPYAAEGTEDALNALYDLEFKRALVYNSTAAFALIDNLQKIVYVFKDVTYYAERSSTATYYDGFDKLSDHWGENVTLPLEDDAYLEQAFLEILYLNQ